MVTSTRRRKIARSTVRRVKRNKLSKNMRRLLKRKVSKRKVMKGGSPHFKIYLVYFTETKGLFSCEAARLPVNVLGLLFYSTVNNDFFYFGFDRFGYIRENYNIFKNKPEYKIFTPQNYELEEETYHYSDAILGYDLAFISHLCGLSIKSKEIGKLKSGIDSSGILGQTVKYCVNLNRRRMTDKLELGYCSKVTNEIKVVGNFDSKQRLNIPSEGEMTLNIDDGVDIYFFLEEVAKDKSIERGINVFDATNMAISIMNNEVGEYSEKNKLFKENRPDSLPDSYSENMKSYLSKLDKCLAVHQPQAQPQSQPQP